MTWEPELDELRRRQELARQMGGPEKVRRQHDGGKLTVRARKTNLPEAAGGVEISVEDSGAGMDARASERAFDDFFTTKPSGSGLGLPFVQRVTDAHGGSVSLSSRVGCGTVVTLRLPAT